MNELLLRYNRGKIFRFAMICGALAIFGVAGLFGSSGLYGYTVSWLGALLFGVFGFPALLWLSFNRRTQCHISPEQIMFHMTVHLNRKPVSNYAVKWENIEQIQFSGSVALLKLHQEQQTLTANFSLLQTDWAKLQTMLPEMPQSTPEKRAELIATFQAA